LGQPILADERKVDIPVTNSIIVAKEYTVDLQYLFNGRLFNEEFHGLNEKAMGMYECLEMKI
jgi:hypothetical protein